MLRRVEPYVAWGYPNHKTVRELLYKRGFGKVWHPRCCRSGPSHEGMLFRIQLTCITQVRCTASDHMQSLTDKLQHPTSGRLCRSTRTASPSQITPLSRR